MVIRRYLCETVARLGKDLGRRHDRVKAGELDRRKWIASEQMGSRSIYLRRHHFRENTTGIVSGMKQGRTDDLTITG
jgi:hypothetical protein